jgi:DNA-directed RNA polymerase specialized sigma24 family protein
MTTAPSLNLHAAPFLTTRWTRVCLAKADSEDGRRALADLCDAYYEPVVAYLKSVLRDADAARDMSHAFFAEMLGGGTIHSADQQRGRFRSYLLGAVKHFVSRQRDIRRALKRGEGQVAVSMDDDDVAEVRDGAVISPDAAFDRQWALTMLERSLAALRTDCMTEGRVAFFDQVRPMLTGEAAYGDQAAAAVACGMNVEAFRVAVHRMKKRLRQCVKAEIAGTLDDATGVSDEMQILLEALSGK